MSAVQPVLCCTAQKTGFPDCFRLYSVHIDSGLKLYLQDVSQLLLLPDSRWMDSGLDGWSDGWMVWMDGWMDGWLDGWMSEKSGLHCIGRIATHGGGRTPGLWCTAPKTGLSRQLPTVHIDPGPKLPPLAEVSNHRFTEHLTPAPSDKM